MGKQGVARTPRKAAAARENAKAPRGRWANTEEREALEAAKAKGRLAAPKLIETMLNIALSSTQESSDRIAAAKTVFDRCGMPVVSSADVKLNGLMPAVLVKVDGLDWPAPVAVDDSGT